VTATELADRLRDRFPEIALALGEATIVVGRGELLGTLERLREDPEISLRFLSSVTATDHPGRVPRYWVVYELASIERGHRLRVKVGVPGEDARIPSVVGLYPTANWHEREVFDLFGVAFESHPDLTRILLPDGWDGHPLRKTEELGGVDTRFKGAFVPPVDRRGS
jgi:NADH-quinone oxidoreductase subunit C